jgi:hypothetical protein
LGGHIRQTIYEYNILAGQPQKKRYHLRLLGIDKKLILKWIFDNWDVKI